MENTRAPPWAARPPPPPPPPLLHSPVSADGSNAPIAAARRPPPLTSRQRVQSKLYNLSLEINALKQEIAMIERRVATLVGDGQGAAAARPIPAWPRLPPRRLTDNELADSRIFNLTLDINTLKEEIHELETEKSLLT